MAKGRKSKARKARAAGIAPPASAPVEAAAESAPERKKDLPVKAPKAAKPAKPAAAERTNIFSKLGRYFADVRAEMTRVVWPTRPEVVSASGIVITTLIIFIIMILIFDQISLQLVQLIARIGGN